MEESASYSINSQAVFISEEQFKALSLNPSCEYVSVSSAPTLAESNLIEANEKNVVAPPEPNMQEPFVAQPVYQPVVYQPVLQAYPEGVVDNSGVIQPVSVSTTDVVTEEPVNTESKTTYATILIGRDLRSCQIQITDCDNSQTPISKPEDLALQLNIYVEPGYYYNVLIPTSLINQNSTTNEDLNRIVQSAITHVYKIHLDVQSAVMEDGQFYNLFRESTPSPNTIEEANEEDMEVYEASETDNMVVVESTEQTEPFEAADDTTENETDNQTEENCPDDDREDGEVIEEEVVDEFIEDVVSEEIISETNTESSKVVVCGYCNFSSPDPSVCQRCRRKLSSSVSDTPKEISSESEHSPTKSDRERGREHDREREHHHSRDSKRRSLGRRCKKKERRMKEEKLQETVSVSLVSSDEEDEKIRNGASRVPLTNVFAKEPIITPDTETTSHDSLRGGGLELESLLDSPDIERIRLDCRSVRFGSYKVKPQDTIVLTEHGVRLKVPSLSKTSTIIKILMKDIVKVLIHFGKSGQLSSTAAPTFFYYITHEASKRIREALNMSSKNKDLFFDPTSKEEQHKRITLLPENVSISDRLYIKSIYESRCLMEELSWNEANDILVRAAPKDVQHNLKKDAPAVKHLPPSSNSAEDIQTIMIYPPQPFKGGISINTEDYGCLRADQFLNDVIIDFYLKYLWLHEFSEEQKKCTHIFSSFFYKRLTMLPPKNNYNTKDNLTPAEKRHARVKGWTKSVDIFDKDFIIIPINEKSHWFLGIICFPGLNGPVRMLDNTPVPSIMRNKGDTSVLSGGQVPAKIWGTTISLVKQGSNERTSIQTRSGGTIHIEPEEERDDSERDEAEADDDEVEPDTTDEESNKEDDLLDEATPRISKVKPNLEAIKQPCILIFDSLAIQSRAKVVATLREYLQVEWKVRHKGKPKDFSKDVFKGAVPKVPQQPNFVDCGLYLLQFVEAFFKNPITDYRMPIRSIKDWFTNEVVSRKRFNIMKLLHDIMRDQNIDTSLLNLPNLDLNPYSEFDDDEEDEDDALGDESMDFGEEAVEEEEEDGMCDDDEDEDDGDDTFPPLMEHTPQIKTSQQKRFEHSGHTPRQVDVSTRRGAEVEVPSRRELEVSSRRGDVEVPSRRELEVSSRRELEVSSRRELEVSSRRELEVSSRRELEVSSRREVEMSRREVDVSRSSSETPQTGGQTSSGGRRFDSPSPRLERPDPTPSPIRPRLPDTVTICEANSKRKLPLSLKDIRNTRLSSNQTTIEKIKKSRME